LLRFEHIGKRFDAGFEIRSFSLEVPSGRTTVLIGPSGCGKSTLLRMAVGLVQPDSGVIRLAGEKLHPGNIVDVRRRTGYVIQDGGLFPHLSAADNVTLMARYLGWDTQRIAARLDELLRLVHLDAPLLERFPAELSGGQRQRIGLMRALMLDPDLLLLDEPLGALDPMIRFELQQDLKEIFAFLAKTVLLVTHDLGEAGYLGETIVLMRDGGIVQQGPGGELIASPADAFVERFISAQRDPFAARTRQRE
jgi:osmoprotectant transport system ATP-binding protein